MDEALNLIERIRNEMEASGGWEGDDKLFEDIMKFLKDHGRD